MYLKFIYFKTILKLNNIWEKFLLMSCFLNYFRELRFRQLRGRQFIQYNFSNI